MNTVYLYFTGCRLNTKLKLYGVFYFRKEKKGYTVCQVYHPWPIPNRQGRPFWYSVRDRKLLLHMYNNLCINSVSSYLVPTCAFELHFNP